MNIEQIKEDGFLLNKTYERIQDLSFISLRIALRAYFNTFKDIHRNISKVKKNGSEQEEKDKAHGKNYIEDTCQAITSFHHFVELIIKDFLTKTHPLLAIDASQKHEIYFDLIFKMKSDEIDFQNVKQLEFSIALDRLVTLIKKEKIDKKYAFIEEANKWLTVLNYLRNRIVHRGVYVIRYEALDYLFGKYALPLLQKIIELPEYGDNQLWQHKELEIDADPISEIIKHFVLGKKYNPFIIALFKELGRAAYENPIYFGGKRNYFLGFDKDTRRRAELLANHICENEYCNDVDTCPVCGVKSLVLFNDSYDTYDENDEEVSMESYIYKLTCFCCSFELKNEGDMNFKDSGINIQNYWKD